MINSKTPVITTSLLICGCFFMLAMPHWVAYLVLAGISLALLFQSLISRPQLIKAIKIFVVEFLGFCLLVGCFVGTMVAAYGLMIS